MDIVRDFDNISKIYDAIESKHTELRCIYVEKSVILYVGKRESCLKEIWVGILERRSFVTHFIGF